MTPLLFILAAAAGAVIRHVVATYVCGWQAVLGANAAGAALLGWLATTDLSTSSVTVLGIGFCGALTTFSSFALEVRNMGAKYGAIYAATTLVCVCGAASITASF